MGGDPEDGPFLDVFTADAVAPTRRFPVVGLLIGRVQKCRMPCVRPPSFSLVLIAELRYNQVMKVKWDSRKAEQTDKDKDRWQGNSEFLEVLNASF